MNPYAKLHKLVSEEMRTAQIHQIVMLKELLRHGGTASVEQIARAVLKRDATQLEYFSEVVENKVGRVLTRNRGLTEKTGNTYHLIGSQQLSQGQAASLVALCKRRIAEAAQKKGDAVGQYRRKGSRPVSGFMRFDVLKRAAFRCELCGVSADDKHLDVDRIHPKILGGKDDLSNYQALCYTCYAQKQKTDETDFRGWKTQYRHREEGCAFCDIQTKDRDRVVGENALAYVVRDAFEVTRHHSLVIPKRHVRDYFGLSQAEINAVHQLVSVQKQFLDQEDPSIDGYNIGMNCGETAGQTIFHCHLHLIPRRRGDVENPRGGVRHVIPRKANYEAQP